MANDANLQEELEAIAKEFDHKEFIARIMTTIQGIRSNNTQQSNVLFDGPVDVEAGTKGESNLNTFLRILGFPATRNETYLSDKNSVLTNLKKNLEDNPANTLNPKEIDAEVKNKRERLLSQDGTLNYFGRDSFGIGGVIATGEKVAGVITTILFNREAKLVSKLTPERFMEMLRDPLPANASVDQTAAGIRRVSLFPLVVNADIPVFPLQRRIAPFFYAGDYVVSRSRLSRPFLEHIIFARTKAFAGLNSTLRPFLEANIENELQAVPGADDAKAGLLKDLGKFNSYELRLLHKFIKTLKLAARDYVQVVKEANVLKAKVDLIMKPKAEYSEKAGENKGLNSEEIREILDLTAGIGEESIVATNKALDQKIERINEELNRLDGFLQIMPTEAIKQSDDIRRLGDPFSLNNLVPDLFVSEFTSLAAYERKGLEDILLDAKRERAKIVQRYESVREGIMYFTGEFVGLSIFDVICVLAALFTVDSKNLIGLLNNSAKDRLLTNDLFYTVKSGSTSGLTEPTSVNDIVPGSKDVTVTQALEAVEEEVEKYFNIVISFIEDFKAAGENKRGATSGEL